MSTSKPRDIRRPSASTSPAAGSPATPSYTPSRNASIARLSSPVPSSFRPASPPVEQLPTPQQIASVHPESSLHAADKISLSSHGQSALAAALAKESANGQPQLGVSPRLSDTSNLAGLGKHDRTTTTSYGSFGNREQSGSFRPAEDPEIIKRHLVQPDQGSGRLGRSLRLNLADGGPGLSSDDFSSLKLQGGDITRQVYRWADETEGGIRGQVKRSRSFAASRPEPESEVLSVSNIRQPGGFRRNYLRRAVDGPAPDGNDCDAGTSCARHTVGKAAEPKLFTNNFLEFLTLYGHFAGENLEEDDEFLESDEYFSSDAGADDQDSDGEPGEDSTLLTPGTRERRRRKHKVRVTGNSSPLGAVLLLLKSFVGTGVLFLPRAYYNGGMVFSCLVLLGVAALSYHCFILLVKTRLQVDGSFGDIGGVLYGKYMRAVILFSIVLSQIGFVSAYTVFTAENLQALILAVSKCKHFIDIKYLILLQLLIYLPLSLVRDISKLGFTAIVGDVFIMLGLIYLYYYDVLTIVHQKGIADIRMFNPSTWTLFIGTAIFTFEGVGMIIPIQEGMKKPDQFPRVLALVMVIITFLFTSIGALSYSAYGSQTETVVLLNLPQDDKFVNVVQFLYSVAILLSTPLQLFPATRIMETALFSRSGKYNPYIKWQKNSFRFFLVCACSLIAWGGANDLDKFVALVGCFACVPLVYIYPPLLHLKAVARTSWSRGLDWAVFVFGVVCFAYTTVLTIQQWVATPAVKSPGYCQI